MIAPNVIQKDIVYSDTMLNLSKMGRDIHLTTIYDVTPYSLQNCLKEVFEKNPNVEFHTIQYSERYEKINFYTNNKVNTSSLEDYKMTFYPIEDALKLTNYLNKTLNLCTTKDEETISIYTVLEFLKELTQKQEIIKENFRNKIDCKLKQNFGPNFYSYIYGMNYKTKELTIEFTSIDSSKYYKHSFSKNNNELYLSKAESFLYTDKILTTLGTELLELYDWLLELENFYTQETENIKSNNTDFFVKINKDEIKIILKEKNRRIFCMKYSFSSGKMYYQCNSWSAIQTVKNNENEFLKKMFIKIEDTPVWMHQILKQKRTEELLNVKLEELKNKEERSLKNKILSLFKK